MKSLLLLALTLLPLPAQTILISPDIRNGGFEEKDGTDFSTTPFWENYFPEAPSTDPVLGSFPKSGSLRGYASGFQSDGPRIHPSQTLPAATWRIQAGDTFTVTVSACAGTGFIPGVDEIQTILHVVDSTGNPVNDPSSPTAYPDRALNALDTLSSSTTYSDFTHTSLPVLPGSPWIGHQIQIRFLNTGDTDHFVILDDVTLTATRGSGPPPATLLAEYGRHDNPLESTTGGANAQADPGLALAKGAGDGRSFAPAKGGALLPLALPSSFSIAFRMRAKDPGSEGNRNHWSEGAALIDGSGTGIEAFGISLRGHQISFGMKALSLFSRSFVTDSRWHHVAATRNAIDGQVRLYIDGELQDIATRTSSGPLAPDLALGRSRDGKRNFTGLIDDLHIYSGVLTPSEIEALWLDSGDPAPSESSTPAEDKPARPNIILIVADDHGYADLSAFPNARPDISTPNLDRIAAAGTLFTQAYVTSPVCSPSRCGYLTGRYQNEWDPAGGWAPRLPASVKHMAEYLKEAGYATAMIGKNDFGQPTGSTNNRDHPTRHGFDRFFGFNAHAHDFWLHSQDITDSVRPPWPTDASAHLGKFINSQLPGGFETFPDDKWMTELFTDRAIEYLGERENQTQPFFLYLSHASVHALIHQAPKSYLDAEGLPELPLYDPTTDTPDNPASYTTFYYHYSRPTPQDPHGIISDSDMRRYYRAHLKAYDDQIGRLLNSLHKTGLSRNTIIIYFSDNGGEALTGANNQPLSGSKYTTFEGGIRVPMMIAWPGQLPAGRTYPHPVSTLDILPTLTEAAGIRNAAPLRGHSLLDPIRRNREVVPGGRTLYWRFIDQWAIRHGDWKLVLGRKDIAEKHTSQIIFNEAALNKVALFNLASDPAEMKNLADSSDPAIQAIRTDLQSLFDAWNASH